MAIPKSREALLIAARTKYDKMWDLINSLPDKGQTGTFKFDGRDKNVRDVLAHLAVWQKLYLDWTNANLKGSKRRFLPGAYTWRDTPKINQAIWQANQGKSFKETAAALDERHSAIIDQISGMISEQLFVKNYYPWTGKTNLASYTTVVTVENYDWAIALLRKYKHELKAPQMA